MPEAPAVRRGGPVALLAGLALLTCVTAIVSSLGAPLVPAIADSYGTSLVSAQWILTAALLSGAVATPLVGRLGSGRRRRPTVVVTLAVVTGGCVLSAASAALGGAFAWMAVGRALQGIGMALTPVAIAVAREAIPAPHTRAAVALLSVTAVAGAGLGYPVTGVVVEHGGLAVAYGLGAALTAATLVLCVVVLPPQQGGTAEPMDWSGALLLSVGLLGVLLAVTRGQAWGWWSGQVLSLGSAGVVVLALWVWWTLRSACPILDLHLAVRPGVLAPHVTALVAGAGMYYLLSLAMIVVQDPGADGWGLGRSVAVASLLLVPYSLTSVVGSRVALMLGRRAPLALLPVGCAMFLGATLVLAFAHDHLWQVLLAMALGGLGSGFTFSSLPLLLLAHVPPNETGSALAVNQLVRFAGMAVGSAVCVVVMSALGGPVPDEVGFRRALLVMSAVWVVLGMCLLLLRGDRRGSTVSLQEAEVVVGSGTDP